MITDDFVSLSSEAAEQVVIGCILRDATTYHDVSDKLKSEDFFFQINRIIFDTFSQLISESKDADVLTVAEKIMDKTGDDVLQSLSDLAVSASSMPNIKSYAQIVKDKSVRRSILKAVRDAQSLVLSDQDLSIGSLVSEVQSMITGLDDGAEKGLRADDATNAVKKYLIELDRRHKSGEELQGLSTGSDDLDYVLNGLKKSNLIIIGARTSIGKSTFGVQIAQNLWVNQKKKGLFFSLEMPTDDITEKLVACTGKINIDDLQKPKYIKDQDVWSRIDFATRSVRSSPLSIVDCSGLHINQLKSYVRKAHIRDPLDFVIVDHIHIMSVDSKQSRERELAEISKGLKQLAMELKIPVIAIAQLNRNIDGRVDKQPRSSDLRDSGSIEQDADVIMLIHREDYYTDSEMNQGIIQVEVTKHRNGKLGKVFFENNYAQSRLEKTTRVMQYGKPQKSYKSSDL